MENENKVIPEVTNEENIETASNDVVEEVKMEEGSFEPEVKLIEKRCIRCQALLEEGQVFCPECGISQKKVCSKCGAELEEGQAFCPSCGEKVVLETENLNADIAMFNAGIEKQKNKKKLLPIILGALGVCVVAIYLISTIFLNPQHYIKKGDYQKAYEVASEEQKENIVRENIIAVVSADCVDSLKDSSSFELKDAWIRFNDTSKVIIMKVVANNSYGGKVVNYWYYSYDKEDEEYSLYTTFSDFDQEKTYSWESTNEKLEKLLKNLAKTTAQNIMSNGVKISDDSIDNINVLFEEDILDDVTLLNVEPQKTE